MLSPIERVHCPSYEEFFSRYDKPSRPVVITGALEGWAARSRWSHAWLGERFADRVVPVALGPRLESRFVQMRMDELIRRIDAPDRTEHIYLRQFPFEREFPELSQDYAAPPYCHPARRLVTNLWLGPAGTVQPFHKDNHNPIALIHNLLVQVVGRKRVALVSGDQDHAMYQRARGERDYHYSQVDFENPDLERFPLYGEANVLETVIEPGEMVFIPGNTWHFVRSLDKSISVSFWWNPSLVVDLVSRLALAATDREGARLAEVYAGSVSAEDADAIGGVDVLIRSMLTLPPKRHHDLLAMFEPSVRDTFLARVKVTRAPVHAR